MPRSRGELLRLSLLHAALADALKAELKTALLNSYEKEQVFEKVSTGYGEAWAARKQARGVVKDNEALADFLEQHTGLTIRREVREVSPSGLEAFLAEAITPVVWQAEQECEHPEGDCDEGSWRPATEEELAVPGQEFQVQDQRGRDVPGVVWFTGGTLHNVTVKGDSTAEARFRRLAKLYATGERDVEDLPW